MKILIVHELFPPDFSGGGEKLVYEMAKHLKNSGHQIKVLTTGNPKIKEYEGMKTVRLPRHRYLMNFALLKIIKEARWADLIQTSTYNACFPSWLAGKILNKPVFCLVMSYWGDEWQKMRPGIKGWLSQSIEKIQVHCSYNKRIFLSGFSKKFALSSGVPPKDNIVINPGVNINNYKPLKKENMVLFSGRFARQKGVYDVLKVARLLPEIKFVMMGWGEEEEKLRKLAPENVKFSSLTLKSGKPFFEMYGKAAVFFLPSYGETFGFVLVEAMASGCTIISTIPLGYEGYLVGKGKVKEMAKEVEELINNYSKSQTMGKKNVELAKKFTWEKFTTKLLLAYNTIIKKH